MMGIFNYRVAAKKSLRVALILPAVFTLAFFWFPPCCAFADDRGSETEMEFRVLNGSAPFSARHSFACGQGNGRTIICGGAVREGFSPFAQDSWVSTDCGGTWEIGASECGFGEREALAGSFYEGKFYVSAGAGRGFRTYNDVWHTRDGRKWFEDTGNAQFSARRGHRMADFLGRLWVVGGRDERDYCNDSWYTREGSKWRRPEPSRVRFDPRRETTVTVMTADRSVWVIGGNDRHGRVIDSWLRCEDPRVPETFRGDRNVDIRVISALPAPCDFFIETREVRFPGREDHACVVYDGRLWVIGGAGRNGLLNDVWFSYDGYAWQCASRKAEFAPRSRHAAVATDKGLFVIGGAGDMEAFADVWFSADGTDWKRLCEKAPFGGRYSHAAFRNDSGDGIILIGGAASKFDFFSDSWLLIY